MHQFPLVKRENLQRMLNDALFGSSFSGRPAVVSVFGRSGVGKTSLVRDVYERHSTKNHFGSQAWARFPLNTSASNIMRLILEEITEKSVTYPISEIKGKFEEELKKKENQKYLLVIDAEVSSIEWKTFLMALPTDSYSRVVQITRNRPEAPPASCNNITIEVDGFTEDATRELFCQRVCVEENGPRYNADVCKAIEKDYRKAILDITEGLPLAIVLLSGLLRTKEFPGEWSAVFDQLMFKQSRRLDSILSLCFDDLPHDIKSCFLYFATFPPNIPIKTSTLVCIWVAEGFLRSKEGKTMEKVGQHYLKELVARHLVNLTLMDYLICDNELVTIHDHVHAFLYFQAQEADFVEIHSGDDFLPMTSARRLSLQNYISRYAALDSPMPKLWSLLSSFEKEENGLGEELNSTAGKSSLTSCLCCSSGGDKSKRGTNSYIRQLLKGSQLLRVIHLQGLEVGTSLPNEIGNVVHLQHLCISSCSLKEIPPSVGRLINLQTLDVRGTNVTMLPESFWNISTLRHVFGEAIVLPKRVGRLKNIQTLESVTPDEESGWDEDTLAQMTYLNCMFIWKLVSGSAEYLSAALKKLMYLKLLNLNGKDIPSVVFTDSDLPRLEIMEIKGKLDVPYQLRDFRLSVPNLTQLSLEKTGISQGFINELARLPFLNNLALYPGSYNGDKLIFSPCGFHKLKTLMIDLEDLKTVEIQESALPEIVDLHIFVFSDDFEIVIIGSRPDIVNKIKDKDPNVFKKVKQIQEIKLEEET